MKHLALILMALTVAAEDAPKQPFVITMHVCPANQDSKECQLRRAEWHRVMDEADLKELLWQDLLNQKQGNVDLSLRARITAICKRLAKNDY